MQTLILKRSFAFVAAIFTATLLMQLALMMPAHAATVTWDGGGDGTTFNDPLNWVGDAVPLADDDISLNTTGLSDVTFDNDLAPDTQFMSIELSGTGSGNFTLTGNAVILTGRPLTGAPSLINNATYNSAHFYVETSITLNGNQSFNANSKMVIGPADGNSLLDLSTYTLTKTGESPIYINASVLGTGNLVISGGNYYATGSAFAGTVTVGDGGILMGDGFLSDVVANSGGTVAPGFSPACLNVNDLTFSSGSTFVVEIEGSTVCSGYDSMQVVGAVDLGGATLSIDRLASYTPEVGFYFVVVDNDGTDVITGTFAGLVEGATTTVDGVTYSVSYVGDDGNDAILTVTSVSAAATAPDTGFGSVATNYIFIALATIVLAGTITFTARKLQKTNI